MNIDIKNMYTTCNLSNYLHLLYLYLCNLDGLETCHELACN